MDEGDQPVSGQPAARPRIKSIVQKERKGNEGSNYESLLAPVMLASLKLDKEEILAMADYVKQKASGTKKRTT